MPGSTTPPGPRCACDDAPRGIAFHGMERVGTQDKNYFVAQWLAYAYPCRRFGHVLAGVTARLGANADRYSFIAVDLHHLLLAGFAGAPTPRSRSSVRTVLHR
jgi:hypothetical protein